MPADPVRVKGLAELNRSLGKISKDLRKSSVAELRDIAKKVRDDARSNAPRRSGKLAASLRYSATNTGARVTSTLPQAPVHEYGGVIRPRGVPIRIKRSEFVGRAVRDNARGIEEQIGDLLERIARENGFR